MEKERQIIQQFCKRFAQVFALDAEMIPESEIKTWKSLENGVHFPVRNGETTAEAAKKTVKGIKEKQAKKTAEPQPVYSPGVKKIAEAFINSQDAQQAVLNGTMSHAEFTYHTMAYKKALKAASEADLKKWETMLTKEIEEAAGQTLVIPSSPPASVAATASEPHYSSYKETPEYQKLKDEFDDAQTQLKAASEEYNNAIKNGKAVSIETQEKSKKAMQKFTAAKEAISKLKKEWEAKNPQTSLPQRSKYSPELAAYCKAEAAAKQAKKDYHAGKITPEEHSKIYYGAQELYNKLSSSDKDKFKNMKAKEKKEAAAQPEPLKAQLHADGEYKTPMGELSPIPQQLTWNVGSQYMNSLNKHNFPTHDNPTGFSQSAEAGKSQQGFTQASIPDTAELKQKGFYSDEAPPSGYFADVPHVKNAHPDIQQMDPAFDMPENAKQNMLKSSLDNTYRHEMHNNVPWASQFGSASGRAAAYAYTAQSNVLNRILRGMPTGNDLDFKDDAAQVTRELDKMLAISRTKKPMIVFRGVRNLPEYAFEGLKLGQELEPDKGFSSTSIDANCSKNFASINRGLFKIRLPAGTSAMSLRYKEGGGDFSKYASEDEILLPRNTKFRVVGFEKGTGSLIDHKLIPVLEVIN